MQDGAMTKIELLAYRDNKLTGMTLREKAKSTFCEIIHCRAACLLFLWSVGLIIDAAIKEQKCSFLFHILSSPILEIVHVTESCLMYYFWAEVL